MAKNTENVVPQLLREIQADRRREELVKRWGWPVLRLGVAVVLVSVAYLLNPFK
jgi:hypothetical protein